jgi:hypothetical protein
MHGRDGAEMLRARKIAGVVGIFETEVEGIRFGRRGAAGLSDEGELPARVRARADCGRLSRRRLVSLVRAGSFGAHYSGAFDWRKNRRGICVCKKSAGMNLKNKHGLGSVIINRLQTHPQIIGT